MIVFRWFAHFAPFGNFSEICDIICNNVYPVDLDILKTNDNDSSSTFLDLDIFIQDGRFQTRLYDKRRDFSFKVVTFPNLRSNIPVKQSYGIFVGEIYRICRSCSYLEDFIKEVKMLIKKLVHQNFDINALRNKLRLFLVSKPSCLFKYWHNFSLREFF